MEYFSAAELIMGNEKNLSFFTIPKSPKAFKKLKKSDWAPLKYIQLMFSQIFIPTVNKMQLIYTTNLSD